MTDSAFFFTALAHQRSTDTIGAGITEMVRRYYDNYTDATSLDPEFLKALEVIVRDTELSTDVEDLVRDTEQAFNREGGLQDSTGKPRTFDTFPEE